MQEHKKILRSFYRTHKRIPSYEEMCALFGFASKNAVARVVKKLVDEGVLLKDAKGHLSPASLWGEVPFVGLVEAGIPAPAEEAELDRVSLEEMLLGDAESTFLLKVKGLSMIDAGICEGDLLCVERGAPARVGDIVVACIDGEWTVKFLREDKRGRRFLSPANKDFSDLHARESLEIGGVVRSVLRTYGRTTRCTA